MLKSYSKYCVDFVLFVQLEFGFNKDYKVIIQAQFWLTKNKQKNKTKHKFKFLLWFQLDFKTYFVLLHSYYQSRMSDSPYF